MGSTLWQKKNRWSLLCSIAASMPQKGRTIALSSSTGVRGGRGETTFEMAERDGQLRVFIVAGEVSGDSIAARLMISLRRLSPFPVHFAGVGGQFMGRAGLNSLFPLEDIAVMGMLELVPHIRKLRRRLHETVEASVLFQPHVIVTVDSKGFSFRLHRKIREKFSGHEEARPTQIHFVAPSFWAWKGGKKRLLNLPSILDHMLCILPFEEQVIRECGLEATFVGHPVMEDDLELKNQSLTNGKERADSAGFLSMHGLSYGAPVVTLLPGSRLQEVKRMLPIFMETLELLKTHCPELATIIITAPNNDVKDHINGIIKRCPLPIITIPGESLSEKYDAFKVSRAALCTSGTASVELHLARLPCVVAYRAHVLTELLIKYKTKLKFISLSNILLETDIIPEVLFRKCTPENLSVVLREVMFDSSGRERQINSAEKLFKIISPPENLPRYLVPAHLGAAFVPRCPSMNAAMAVLYSARKHCRGF
ncbi:lipid-A-disaccharide synthase B isoform X2 [Wolffia australiana]